MRNRAGSVRLIAVLLLLVSPCGVRNNFAQIAPKAPATVLSIGGDVARPCTLTLAELKALPRTTVTVQDNSRTIVYEGVLVGELLSRAGAPLGRDLAGKALASYVKATAADGYEVVFSLAELDPAMTSNDIIVADTVDGKALPDSQGPIRLATPHDKRGARALHLLVRLDVVRLAKQ